MENAGKAATIIAIVLLGAGGFIAYEYYNIRYQSPIVLPSSQATLNLFVTTSQTLPANTTSLTIYFSEVDAHDVNGTWVKLFTTQTSFDLAKVKGTAQSVGSFSLPPGGYDSLRAGISQASEVTAGSPVTLQVPASAQSGLVIPFPVQFNIPAGATGGATLDVTASVASGTLSLTVSATLTLGVGVTTGTTSSTSISSSSSATSTKTCQYWFWPC